VTIQAQILDLLMKFKKDNKMAMLLITHDLSIVANMADDVYVMYSGKIVERGSVQHIFKTPLHPYTIGLLRSVPRLDDSVEEFIHIPDTIPNPMMKPKGCYFHPRCEMAEEVCRKYMPELKIIDGDRGIRCWNYNKNKHLEI
jgi:oligopeptide/dipeptide ABC transporter ATP-binding protein